jgi:peptide-methionine (R)-S-oxide reductase
MNKLILVLLIVSLTSCVSKAQNNLNKKEDIMTKKVSKTDTEWKKELTDQEFYVLRMKGTDRPSDEGYTKHFKKGTYVCRACKIQLFKSDTKFDSHCGWPSFDNAIKGTIIQTKDTSLGMIRTEITCAACDGHIGHIFNDGPKETTGMRYCVNTSSIEFIPSKEK